MNIDAQNTIKEHQCAPLVTKKCPGLEHIRATMPGPPQKGRKRPRSDKGQQDKDKKVSNGTAKTKQQIRSVERLLRKEVTRPFVVCCQLPLPVIRLH